MQRPNTVIGREHWAFVAGLGIVVALVLRLASANLDNPNFSFDESGQFWMARGLFHYSAPLSHPGSFRVVLAQNASWNWDPGGFTLLCSVWTSLATRPAFLRLLPYSFFILMMGCLGLLAAQYTNDRALAVAAATTPVLFPLLVHHAFELRAYSMEACGTIASLVLLNWITRRGVGTAVWRWAIVGLVLAVMMTSRYSFFVIMAVVALRLVWMARRLPPWAFVQRSAALGLPVALSLLGIVSTSDHLFSTRPSPLSYVSNVMLRGATGPQTSAILSANFLSFTGCFLLAYPLAYWTLSRTMSSENRRLFRNAVVVITAAHGSFALLSLAGKYPWNVEAKWSIAMVALSCAALVSSVALGWHTIDAATRASRRAFRAREWIGLSLVVASIASVTLSCRSPVMVVQESNALAIIVLACACIAIATRYWPSLERPALTIVLCLVFWITSASAAHRNHYESFESSMINLSQLDSHTLQSARFFVSEHAGVTVRYLLEFGPLKDRVGSAYPGHFTFASSQAKDPPETMPYDYFVLFDFDLAELHRLIDRISGRAHDVTTQGPSLLWVRNSE